MSAKILSRFKLAIAAIALVTAAMIVKAAFLPALNSQAAVAAPFDAPFDLIDQNGKPFTNASFNDAPRVLFFGYTSCPDICPTTLAALSRWIDVVKPTRTRFVFVTVDPARDTPQVLKSYLSSFAPGIIGLTGKPDDVSRMLDAYHIFRQRVDEPGGSYSMNHTATLFLVDGHGKLQDMIAHGEDDKSAIEKLRRLDASTG